MEKEEECRCKDRLILDLQEHAQGLKDRLEKSDEYGRAINVSTSPTSVNASGSLMYSFGYIDDGRSTRRIRPSSVVTLRTGWLSSSQSSPNWTLTC